MAARTVSELANWDGRLDQQRQDSKWRRPSSSLVREPYHTPLENQRFETFQPPVRVLDYKRAEQSALRSSNIEQDSLTNSPENTRLAPRVNTTSIPSHDIHHYHRPSISRTNPNPALPQSSFVASSKSSHLTPNSSVLASHVYNSRPSSSRERNALFQAVSKADSEVIDLTLEDTEDELPVGNSTHISGQYADPGPSRQSSWHSSSVAPEQSLFTPPPPPRRRTRLFIDYVAAPKFPKGLTKADYRSVSSHSPVPLPEPAATSTLEASSLAQFAVTNERTPPLQKRKGKGGKGREHDVVSSPGKCERPNDADVAPSVHIDTCSEHEMIPLEDDDAFPPLTALDLATNTRFYFAHAWRAYASELQNAEPGWTFKFSPFGKACTWVRSVEISSPRIPGTTGFVSSERLRSWEPAPPDGSEKSSKHISDGLVDTTGSHSTVEVVDSNYLLLPNDALPISAVASDTALSKPTLAQSLSSTIVDMEHDMNRYFNGLSDSPNKDISPPRRPSLTHTFRPYLLQPANLLGFPSLELDPPLADTGAHECFLGVPPSPTIADMATSITPGFTPDSPFEPANYSTPSSSNVFAGEAPSTNAWSFEQGEGLLPDNTLPLDNHVPPTALGTIDPSLLGPQQPQIPSRPSKDAYSKRRSKLPEPVIYFRRPIDSSTLPLVSGKRAVQIKYRDPGGSPTTPAPSVSRQASPKPVDHPIKLSTNDADDSPRGKRPLVPLGERRDHRTASESESDFVPESSMSNSKPKLKLKRPIVKDKKSSAEHQVTDVPAMTFCHQCRHTSDRPKMLCSNTIGDRVCGKRFCNRCILNRYPDITFDQNSAGFLCPVCTNTCNCSHCARSRGEEFVSMRLGGLAASIFKAKVTLVRDAGRPRPRVDSLHKNAAGRGNESAATTPTPEPGALPTPSPFWAHVYGMDGGRVGSAFMSREHMERLQTRGPSPPPPPAKPRRAKTKVEKPRRRGPRVFIGRPLASWQVRAVRDAEPGVDVGVGVGGAVGRCYIGDRVALYEPYGRMPGMAGPTLAIPPGSRCSTPALDSDGRLTPLEELEGDDWPQPGVGECCLWPPPPGTIVEGPPDVSPAGAVGMGADAVEGQDLGPRLDSGDQDVAKTDADVAAVDGDERASASTALSEQDLARAISAALAALSVELPPR